MNNTTTMEESSLHTDHPVGQTRNGNQGRGDSQRGDSQRGDSQRGDSQRGRGRPRRRRIDYRGAELVLVEGMFNPDRPYSNKELEFHKERLFRDLYIGPLTAHHDRCGHYYRVKKEGRKHKEIQDSGNQDAGNCSVCWKLHKTPEELRESAIGLVSSFRDLDNSEFELQDKLDIELSFYTWLYREFN